MNSYELSHPVSKETAQPSRRSVTALDWLNFTAADIPNAVGPFLAIYLLNDQHWNPAQIGMVMGVQSVASIGSQIPLSAWIDDVNQKRWIIAVVCIVTAIVIWFMTHFPLVWLIIVGQLLIGAVWVTYQPTLNAISLGLVSHQKIAGRLGRNEAFNHVGNVASSVLAGLVGKLWGFISIFNLLALQGVLSAIIVLFVRQKDIHSDWARGATPGDTGSKTTEKPNAEGLKTVFKNRNVLILVISILLFHLANAAMMPLVGQVLAKEYKDWASVSTSACIIIGQLIMIPVALFTSRYGQTWGRKPVFAIAYIFLILRGILYVLSNNPFYLIGVQALDGVGAGIYGVLGSLMASDLAQGTGRFNLIQGLVIMALSAGVFISNLLGGFIANSFGYNASFLILAGIAAFGLVFFWRCMPETKNLKPQT